MIMRVFIILTLLVHHLWADHSYADAFFSEQEVSDEWASDWDSEWGKSEEPAPWTISYFTEVLVGGFANDPLVDSDFSAFENRWQLSANRYFGNTFFSSKFEFLLDDVSDDHAQLLVRELFIDHNLTDSLSVRAGQQVLTWGTGDFIFLNDLFPKDWQAMFSGREDSYLKAPSASIKLTQYNDLFNTDFVWTPVFTEDEYVHGERFSYFNPAIEATTDQRLSAYEPSDSFENGEFALRLSKTLKGVEYALYGYRGFYKQPMGYDPVRQSNFFARLNSYGASVRGSVAGGILNAEMAYWDSREDKQGDNPLIPNSQFQSLIGYEREAIRNLTLAFQWWLQITDDYSAQKLNAPQPQNLMDKYHHTLTSRITYLSENTKWTYSLFAFYSPSSDDAYVKPKVSYRRDDHWLFEVGGNLFWGSDEHSQWGQFEENTNLYSRVRYQF